MGNGAVEEVRESRDQSTVVVQRRRQLRKKTFLGGMIVSSDGALVVDCTIRDLSESGARVRIPNSLIVPERAFLIVSRRETAYEVAVVRSRGDELGLKFIASYSLDDLSGKNLTFLRRLAVERLPRMNIA
jgi:hypothetical protein